MLLLFLCIGAGALFAPRIFANGDRVASGGVGFAVGALLMGFTLIVSPASSQCLTKSHGVVGYLMFNSFKACPTVK
jgi:hypothetical protein